MSKPKNPPAFPTDCTDGMTLRDWFAGQAVPMLIKFSWDGDLDKSAGKTHGQVIAEEAYALADAMLTERERNQ